MATGSVGKEICLMRETDDLLIKQEIDEIVKRIEAIVQNIEHLDPNRQKSDDNRE
jgi:hypothetical protein